MWQSVNGKKNVLQFIDLQKLSRKLIETKLRQLILTQRPAEGKLDRDGLKTKMAWSSEAEQKAVWLKPKWH